MLLLCGAARKCDGGIDEDDAIPGHFISPMWQAGARPDELSTIRPSSVAGLIRGIA
jgi:hypothetical protein